MSALGRQLLSIILGLAIILSAIPIAESSEGEASIEVLNISQKPLTVKVYVYPEDLDLNTGLPFSCLYHDRIVQTFYKELLVFRKAVFRFVSEHPEYSKLAKIEFVNVSSPEEADVTLRVTRGTNESGVLMHRIGGDEPNEIQIDCSYPPRTGEDFPSIILHEIFHSLGVGHASTEYTDKGEPELMRFIRGETYPSTLDFYALHELYFGDVKFDGNYKTSLSLPEDLEYQMVVPYDVELKKLRDRVDSLESDNENLWRHLRNASDIIEYLNEENRKLRQENEDLHMVNEALEEQVAELWGHLQNANMIIDYYEEENQRLKANLTWCLQAGLELGRKCNQTIRDLAGECNDLLKNYTLCREWMTECYDVVQQLRIGILVMTALGIISVLAYHFYIRRYLREE